MSLQIQKRREFSDLVVVPNYIQGAGTFKSYDEEYLQNDHCKFSLPFFANNVPLCGFSSSDFDDNQNIEDDHQNPNQNIVENQVFEVDYGKYKWTDSTARFEAITIFVSKSKRNQGTRKNRRYHTQNGDYRE